MAASRIRSFTRRRAGWRDDDVALRRLDAGDRAAIAGHLRGLDAADRHARFHAYVDDSVIDAYAARLDFARMILIGAIDARSGAVVGLGEAHLDDAAAPAFAELAVSVSCAWRGRGLGFRLVAAAAAAAFARGAARVEFAIAAENCALRRIATLLGGRIDAARGLAAIDRPSPDDAGNARGRRGAMRFTVARRAGAPL